MLSGGFSVTSGINCYLGDLVLPVGLFVIWGIKCYQGDLVLPGG